MTTNDLLEALARLRVETGSLACLGCGHEHNCSTHGCQQIILSDTLSLLRTQAEASWMRLGIFRGSVGSVATGRFRRV